MCSWGVNSLEALILRPPLQAFLLLSPHPTSPTPSLSVRLPAGGSLELLPVSLLPENRKATSLLSLWDLGFSILTIKLYSGGLEHFQAVNIFANKSLQHVKIQL